MDFDRLKLTTFALISLLDTKYDTKNIEKIKSFFTIEMKLEDAKSKIAQFKMFLPKDQSDQVKFILNWLGLDMSKWTEEESNLFFVAISQIVLILNL